MTTTHWYRVDHKADERDMKFAVDGWILGRWDYDTLAEAETSAARRHSVDYRVVQITETVVSMRAAKEQR